MTLTPSSNAYRTKILAAAALATTIVGFWLPTFGQNSGNSGNSGPVDHVSSLNPLLYSVAPGINSTTRTWMNLVLNAMGSPSKLGQIVKSEFTCEMTGSFGTMSLSVMSSTTGEFTFHQTVRSPVAGVPGRTTIYTYSPSSGELKASCNGGQSIVIDVTDECMALLRRTADLWNPVLTMIGQFESVDQVGIGQLGTTWCTVLTMGKPRIEGLTAGKIYLNNATLLPLGTETTVTRDIPISGKYTITGWQTIAGINVPRTAEIQGPDGTSQLTFTSVRLYGTSGEL